MAELVQIEMLRACRPSNIARGTPLLRSGERASLPDYIAKILVGQGYAKYLEKALDEPDKNKMQASPQVKKGH